MDARYTFRKSPWLDACQGAPESFEQVLPRLYRFLPPFVTVFPGTAAAQHATISVWGLRSDVKHKHSASSAYRFGPSRLPLPGFMGWAAWDDAPLREE